MDDTHHTIARIAAGLIVGSVAAALATRVFGTKAGYVTAVAVVLAHERFDAPLASYIESELLSH